MGPDLGAGKTQLSAELSPEVASKTALCRSWTPPRDLAKLSRLARYDVIPSNPSVGPLVVADSRPCCPRAALGDGFGVQS
jgi:hypothetical protein